MIHSVRRAALAASLLALAASAFSLAACSRDPARPRSVLASEIDPPLVGVPQRILPATTAAAEYLAALIDPARIVALPEQVADFSTRDFASPPFVALPRFPKYAAEPLLALEPDLVITMAWQSQDTTAVLRREKIPVLILRTGEDYESVRETLALLGGILGAEQRAAEITADLDARAAALRERARSRPKRRALVYSNDGTGGWAAGSRTTAGALLELTGLVNAGAEDGVVEHQQVDMERVLRIAPDVFVCGSANAAEGGSATRSVLLAAKPLADLEAIRAQRIAVVPSVLLSADSPALLDAAEALERELLRLDADAK